MVWEWAKIKIRDVTIGPLVENPSSNEGDMGLIPGQETKIPYVVKQLSLHTATTEPVHHNERFCILQGTSYVQQLTFNAAKI